MRCTAAVLILLAVAGMRCRADLTILQQTASAVHSGPLTLRIKGDKARVDVPPRITMLIDLVTGDTISINHQSQRFVRISGVEAAKLRRIADDHEAGDQSPKLTPTGRKEKVGTRDCEVYTWRVGGLVVTDWIDPNYVDWQPVLAELHRFQSAGLADSAASLMPPLADFPGMVIKREMSLRGVKTTSILVSESRDPIDPALFDLPKGYQEQPAPKMPER